MPHLNMDIVLQKYIADSGYCSRRQAEELIRVKEVKVNGKIAELGQRVTDRDIVL
ncbi:23S rRNA pseudouridine synthase F, partial [Candidatus Falkowbacteria bacterium CG23_combo_of_CG06-09_8_20_14_all_41_10]